MFIFNHRTKFVDDGRPRMLILYGTQTGTSEDYSRALESDSQHFGFNTEIKDLNNVKPEDLQSEKLCILLVSTYGEGEPPDRAKDFYESIHDLNQEQLDLSNLEYSVFGLGNSQYTHYQAMSRFFDKKLKSLGANQVFQRGEGDVDINLEEAFEDWKSNLLSYLSQKYNTQMTDDKIVSKYELKWLENFDAENSAPFFPPRGIPDAKHPAKTKVTKVQQLLPQGCERSTVHLEFNIKGASIAYEAGDHLAIYAKNNQSLVFKYAARLNVKDKLQSVFSFTPVQGSSKNQYFPRQCSLFDVLTYFIDLSSLPRRKLVKALSWYATDKEEKQELALMASNSEEGKNLFNKVIRDPKRMVIDVLNQYKSVDLPLEIFLELMPIMPPRYYSIASSKSKNPHSIHIVVAVVKYITPLGKQREGVCSSYLESLKPGDDVYLYVRPSSFHLPSNSTRPIIMIGPGTGFAPLRGFLQQRMSLNEKGKQLGNAFLFFGCRRKNEDWIYQEEMTLAQQSGSITNLYVAFSRDQKQKIYVQNRLYEVKHEIFQALENGGYIFICGDAKYMAKQVHDTLHQIVKECGNLHEHDTLRYLEKLETSGRYLKDVWSA